MAVYAIGDLQGCYDEFARLIDLIKFDPSKDKLWLTGDLVNRGPKSLQTLRYVKSLGRPVKTVLGNHDLHLLAIAESKHRRMRRKDTFKDVLKAKDRDELLHWLRHQPLARHSRKHNTLMVHAGLPPQWDVPTALKCAKELESVLQSDERFEFYRKMYGNLPNLWSPKMTGMKRLRFITNCLTRMRYCTVKGRLVMRPSGPPGTQTSWAVPWFEARKPRWRGTRIVFGHWAALGEVDRADLVHLDTGCVWGGSLTAARIDKPGKKRKHVCCRGCLQPKQVTIEHSKPKRRKR